MTKLNFLRKIEFLSKLKARLLLFIILGVLPLFGLVLYNAAEQRERITATVQNDALRLAQIVAGTQEQYIESSRLLFLTLAQISAIRNHRLNECNPLLTELTAEYPFLTNIYTVTPDGDSQCSGIPAEVGSINVAQETWFLETKQKKDFVVSQYQIGPLTGRPIIPMGYPLFDDEGEWNGIVGGGLSLRRVNTVITETPLPDGTAITVIDANGTILAMHPEDPRYIGQNASSSPFFPEIVERGEGVTQGEGAIQLPRLLGFSNFTYGTSTIYVIVSVPEEVAFAEINQFQLSSLISLSLVSSVVLLVAWFSSDFLLMRPVNDLVTTTMQVKAGDLSARTGGHYGITEFDILARRFNDMTSTLQQREHLLLKTNSQLAKEIEERKLTEEELRISTKQLQLSFQELEQFAYVASHDLQEPLRVIAGYLQLIERRYKGKLDSDADEFIAFAVDAAKRMQFLINDLLVYSRIGRKGKPFDCLSVETVLKEALDNLKFTVEEQQAVITHDPLPELVVDASQLVLVFQNLISNAIKFRGENAPHIHIGAVQQEKHWQFSVKDNGIGIDPQFNHRIFLIFQRLHTREEYPGTGIGLAICQKIIEHHGGRIWVESQPEQGATFYFTISTQLRTNNNEPVLRETR